MPQQPHPCPPSSPALRTVVRWWLSAYTTDRLPSRRDIDLNAIRHALPYVWLVEHLPQDDGYRYRLAGEHVNDVFGFSLRGKRLRDVVEPHLLETVRARFQHVRTAPGVVHALGRVYMRIGGHREGERLILPLSDDGVKVSHLFGVTDYGEGRHDAWVQPPEYMTESFLEIADVLAWRTALQDPTRA